MKYLIVTDIHGSRNSTEILLKKFKQSGADKILILGDTLYHGPRNALLDDYDPKFVMEALNNLAENIVAVRGNCDAEVDQMVLNFMLNESVIIEINGKSYFCTHGHKINPESPAKIARGSVVLYGHFHVTKVTNQNEVTYLNIASITYPKGDSCSCYGILDESGVAVYDLEDREIVRVQ